VKTTIGQLALFLIYSLFYWNTLNAQETILTDERDGQQYRMITIGNQTWMADNLNYDTENSFSYANKKRNSIHLGKLYTWDAAIKACPTGWHLPLAEEWQELINFYEGDLNAGLALRIDGTSSFNAYYTGFMSEDGAFYDLGNCIVFWTATSCDENDAWRCFIDRGFNSVVQDYFSKGAAFSVRCVRNN